MDKWWRRFRLLHFIEIAIDLLKRDPGIWEAFHLIKIAWLLTDKKVLNG